MTGAQQKRLYFPCWNRCANAQGWRLERGRLAGARREHWGGPETSELYDRAWNIASALAALETRAVRPDDFRHALNAMAVQRAREYRSGKETVLDLSDRATASARLEGVELDLVIALFALLTDPDQLDPMMTWSHPENAERAHLNWRLERYPHAVVQAIARNLSGGKDWFDLDLPDLRRLLFILRQQQSAKRPLTPALSPAGGEGETHVAAAAGDWPAELPSSNNPF